MHKYEEVKEEYEKRGYNILISKSDYKKATQKFTITDNQGYYYETSYKVFRLNRKPDRFSVFNPYTIQNIKHWIDINGHSDVVELVSTEYEGATTDKYLKWKCLLCGNEFKRSWNDMQHENKNKYCFDCSRKLNCTPTNHDLKDVFIENGYTLLSEYKGANKYVDVMDEDGYKYRTTRNSFIKNGKPLPIVASNPYVIENIKNYIKLNNINVELLSDKFTNSKDFNLEFLCLECGENTFVTNWNNFTCQDKIRCDKCSKKQSISSYKVEKILKEFNVNYKKEYRINECRNILPLPFDFAIFDNNKLLGLIEVDGEQHYNPSTYGFGNVSEDEVEIRFKEQKIRDNIKTNYCVDNNIPFLRISYYDIKCWNERKILKEFLENIV